MTLKLGVKKNIFSPPSSYCFPKCIIENFWGPKSKYEKSVVYVTPKDFDVCFFSSILSNYSSN